MEGGDGGGGGSFQGNCEDGIGQLKKHVGDDGWVRGDNGKNVAGKRRTRKRLLIWKTKGRRGRKTGERHWSLRVLI